MTEAIGKGSNPVWDRKGKISVVIPVYCSQESLEILVPRLVAVLSELAQDLFWSMTAAWRIAGRSMKQLKQQYEEFLKIVRL